MASPNTKAHVVHTIVTSIIKIEAEHVGAPKISIIHVPLMAMISYKENTYMYTRDV